MTQPTSSSYVLSYRLHVVTYGWLRSSMADVTVRYTHVLYVTLSNPLIQVARIAVETISNGQSMSFCLKSLNHFNEFPEELKIKENGDGCGILLFL